MKYKIEITSNFTDEQMPHYSEKYCDDFDTMMVELNIHKNYIDYILHKKYGIDIDTVKKHGKYNGFIYTLNDINKAHIIYREAENYGRYELCLRISEEYTYKVWIEPISRW